MEIDQASRLGYKAVGLGATMESIVEETARIGALHGWDVANDYYAGAKRRFEDQRRLVAGQALEMALFDIES